MKKILFLSGIVFALIACNSNESDTITKLKEQKDSLKIVYDEIAQQIALIDEDLKALDTTIRLPLITTNVVEKKTFEHFIDIQGAVDVGGNALVYPEAPGKVLSIRFKEGSKVNKGDLIIQLDAGSLYSIIKEVETNYHLANDLFEKQNRLWKDKIGSEVQYIQAKSTKESLEQKLITLREQLDMYSIRAPFSGVIDKINPKVGEAVNPAFPAVRVINYKEVYLTADVSENYILTIQEGSKVKVFFPALNKEFIAQIAYAGNYINPNNRTFKVNIDLGNFKGSLKPNLLADIKIRDFKADSAVVIFSKIIQQDRKGNEFIYVVKKKGEKNITKKIIITTGLSYQKQTIVLSGLKGDEVYIDKGARSVQNGDLVEIMIEED